MKKEHKSVIKALNWTPALPTKPGWYWIKAKNKKRFIAQVVYVEYRSGKKLCVWYYSVIFGRMMRNRVSSVGKHQWAGPIKEPL